MTENMISALCMARGTGYDGDDRMIQENATTTSHHLSLPAQYGTHESHQEDKKLRAFTVNETLKSHSLLCLFFPVTMSCGTES